MTTEKLIQALHECGESYEGDLEKFKPTNKNGKLYIHESNLIIRYYQALKKILCDDCICWTEFSLQGKERIDAVVYSVSKNTLILIEAKRIRQGKTKGIPNWNTAEKQIKKDTERMTDKDKVGHIIDNKHATFVYRVMLAQVWVKTQDTKGTFCRWMNKELEELFPNLEKESVFVASTKQLAGNENNKLKLLIAVNT